MDPPINPQQSDCCGSGCFPCIFDIYEEQLKKYNKFLKDGICASEQINENCLSLTKYSAFEFISFKKLTQDTNLYTFKHLSCNNCKLQYGPGQYLLLRGNEEENSEKHFTRAYSLLPVDKNNNCFDIIVKLYANGKLSNYFRDMKLGTNTLWRGPYGNYVFDNKFKFILMICQGTGIAPYYSLLNTFLNDSECNSFFKLYYCCRDIYFHKEIFNLSSFWNFTYEIFQSGGKEEKAFYQEKLHRRRLCKSDIDDFFTNIKDKGMQNKTQILICGSDDFSEHIKQILELQEQKYSLYIF